MRAASPPDYPHDDARLEPHELEPKDVAVKDARAGKFSAQRTEGVPAGDRSKEKTLGTQS